MVENMPQLVSVSGSKVIIRKQYDSVVSMNFYVGYQIVIVNGCPIFNSNYGFSHV